MRGANSNSKAELKSRKRHRVNLSNVANGEKAAGTSEDKRHPNDSTPVAELTGSDKPFQYGSIVWAHVQGHPWWPAFVSEKNLFKKTFYYFGHGSTGSLVLSQWLHGLVWSEWRNWSYSWEDDGWNQNYMVHSRNIWFFAVFQFLMHVSCSHGKISWITVTMGRFITQTTYLDMPHAQ